MIREPCVSGLFYASDKENLEKSIDLFFDKISKNDVNLKEMIAGIVPHAGYLYSGQTASYTFNVLKDTSADTYIIIGPNHTGYGTRIDLCDYEKWKTPLGLVDVDKEFVDALCKCNPDIFIDNAAHIKEHSIEVEIPFLQHINNDDFKIVPIVISQQLPDICKKLAKSIKEVSKKLNRKIIVLASTDLTHYEDSDTASFYDEKVMNSIKDMDMDEMINNILEYDISMCGYGPVITAVTYSKLCNYNSCNVLKYSNSGDVSGDYDSVVGYMSAIIGKELKK